MTAMTKLEAARPVETFRVEQDISYNWEYDSSRERLMRLYENAKRDQWNATERLDWSIDVDPESEIVPDMGIGIYGTPMWDRLDERQRRRLRHEALAWQLSQFLHGEQGALLATAQVVDTVPWYEAKQYGATQVMDEARHVEVYRRFLQEKIELHYPINPELKKLLDTILTDSRWDMKFLGMQVMVEGLALAAFSVMRDTTTNPLLRDLTAAVMEDEARHVAFGVLSLREFCADMSEKERTEREDFVYEAAVLMRDRLINREVWERMGLDVDACVEATMNSPLAVEFRRRLFSKIVPNVKSLGLLSERQRERFAELGILEFEHNTSSDVDQAIEEERRMRSGEARLTA
ncbi:MAG: ferritin-like domain-containing protein [Candidatus Dadabacteria bacterium]|nr:MAG: ferritin-like domain-containing protein [Candidatus Dadabacteria bacterium]